MNDALVKLKQRQIIIAISLCCLVALTIPVMPHPVVILVFGLLPIGVWFVLRQAVLVVILFIAFSFFRIHEAIPVIMPFKFPLLLALGSLFVVAVRLILTRTMQIEWTRELTFLTIFFVLVTIGILFSKNKDIGFEYWKSTYIKIYIMTLAGFWMLEYEKHFKLLMSIILVSGLIVSAVAISNKLNGIGLVEETRVTIGRSFGSSLGDPNDLALVLLFPFAYTLSMLLQSDQAKSIRFAALIITGMLAMAILFTQSRGGLLGMVGVSGYFGYQRVKSKVLLFSVGSLALLVLFAVAGVDDRATTASVEDSALDASALGRLHAWEAAWYMALDNPFLGVGLSNFYNNYFFYTRHWDGLNHAVHSTWFSVMAETGLVGFIIFVTLIILLFKKAFFLKHRLLPTHSPSLQALSHAAPAGIVGFIISGTFLTQAFTWPLYLQIIIILSLHRFLNAPSQNENASSSTNANRNHLNQTKL